MSTRAGKRPRSAQRDPLAPRVSRSNLNRSTHTNPKCQRGRASDRVLQNATQSLPESAEATSTDPPILTRSVNEGGQASAFFRTRPTHLAHQRRDPARSTHILTRSVNEGRKRSQSSKRDPLTSHPATRPSPIHAHTNPKCQRGPQAIAILKTRPTHLAHQRRNLNRSTHTNPKCERGPQAIAILKTRPTHLAHQRRNPARSMHTLPRSVNEGGQATAFCTTRLTRSPSQPKQPQPNHPHERPWIEFALNQSVGLPTEPIAEYEPVEEDCGLSLR